MKVCARNSVWLVLSFFLATTLTTSLFAQTPLAPNSIQVSRVQYDGNNGNLYTSPYTFPEIFNDPNGLTTANDIQEIAGIQGSVYIDQFNSVPLSTLAGTLSLPATGTPATYPTVEPGSYITTSFSSKSEGALMLSPNGQFLTYFGYEGNDQLDDVSNSYSPDPNFQLSPNSYTLGPNIETPITINAASESSTTATITLASPITVASGAYFTIAGMISPYTGYNGTWATTKASNNSTTITLGSLPKNLTSCSSAAACGGSSTYDPPYNFYDREVALINSGGLISLTPIDNADSGDNPRGAITIDGDEFYTVGNSDSTEATPADGPNNPGLTIGVRCGTPEYPVSYQLGLYTATDRPDESAKKHVKDNNWRGVGIYTDGNGNQQLYVTKGSGGNGDDGFFQVGAPLPSCTLGGTDGANTITELWGAQATVPNGQSYQTSPYLPFGFWMANPTTLYVADEGNSPSFVGGSSPSFQNSTNGTFTLPQLANGLFASDPYAGLEKWSLVNGTWQYDYTIQAGLNLYQPVTVNGYTDILGEPLQSYTYGLRNMTGNNNGDGTATIYAITAQFSAVSGGEPDPTSLVGITDQISATTLPANEQFITLQTSGTQEVYRGVAYVPPAPGFTRALQTITFPTIGTQTYGVSPITLTASATSQWPIAYTVSGPATLSGNVLTITGAGSVTVQANQSGNTDYSAAATVSQTFTVNQEPQTITLSNVPANAVYGTTFTVSASGGTSGNAVVLTSAGSCTNVGATYTITSGSGSCSVIANQAGNNNYLAAPQVTDSVSASPAATSISVTSVSPASETYAQDAQVTITAVLSWSGIGNAPTASDVTISGNGPSSYGTTSCSAPSGTTLTCTNTYTPTLADSPGSYTESASFSGDGNYSSSASTASGNFTITQETTTTTVACTPSSGAYGTSVTCTATVSTENGDVKGRKPSKVKSQQATGTVTWSANSGCSASTLPGTATCTTSVLPVGADSIVATYSGDSGHSGSSNSSNVTISLASTSISVTSVSPASETYAQDAQITITAVLSWSGSGTTPSASALTIGGNGPSAYGTTSCSAPSGNTLTCTNTYTPTLADNVGTYTESAAFAGDANYSSSASTQSGNFTIAQETTTTSVACTPSTSSYGSPVTCTATVNTLNGDVKGRKASKVKSQQATGTITWTSNTGCSPSSLSGDPGTASCTTSILTGGTDTITATYSGDTNHSGGSGAFNQTVNPIAQTITFTTNAPPTAIYNTSFTVAATASSGLAVTFTASGSCTVSGAKYTMTSGSGSCLVYANQAGNANYKAAPQVLQTVGAAPATQTITVTTPAPATAVAGSPFTVAATASSGYTVAYGSSGDCTNSGANFTMGNTVGGTCTVTFSQSGNNDYKAAPQVTETVTATQGTPPTVTFTGAPGSAGYLTTFTVATTSGGDPSVPTLSASGPCTISGTTVTITGHTGTCTLTAFWAATSVYSAATLTQTTTATKANPVITWPNPAAITYGTPLSATQLDATANPPGGTFTYSPISGKILAAGTQTLSVKYVPSDTADYNTVTQTATLVVNQASTTTTITSISNPNPTKGQKVTVDMTVVNSTASKVSGEVTVSDGFGDSCSGTVSSGSASCSIILKTAGSITLTASYPGDSNNLPSSGTYGPFTVNP